MKKLAMLVAALAALPALFAAPVFADSPGQLSNGDNNYKVRNVTANGAYGKSVALKCNEVVKYSITLSNTDFGLLRNLTVKANLPNNISASATNADDQTTSVSGSVNVTVPAGANLKYVSGSTQLFTSAGSLVRGLADGITTGGVNAGNLNGSTAVFVQFQAKADCPTPEVKKITVCELATKKIVTIDEKDFDSSKHSKNLADCAETPKPGEITVCEVKTGKVVTIKENEFDSSKHTKDLSKCAEKEVPVATELPRTGANGMAVGAVLSALVAGAAYALQRRNTLG
ncbi:MAG TPA: hypothetical protein VGE13_02435 [Candidatus Saccharimonadales bacterium]